jgi:Rhodopirellula transposase DDE domain
VSCLRLSIDTKANVVLGDFSRKGKARGAAAVKALDHDLAMKGKLAPVGILEVVSGRLDLQMGTSHKTSDLIADSLESWWERRAGQLDQIKELVLNLDNGPENSGRRTQFLARMVAFSEKSGLRLRLVYDPPYHSKYNPIERCWGALEKHWNGALLSDTNTALAWACTMTWKGLAPTVSLNQKIYAKAARLFGQAKQALEARLQRSPELRWWDILITPSIPEV